MKLRFVRRGTLTQPLIYDNRWGTATDASGWITFGLKPGCRRIWLDSINGLDSNDGLTSSTPKQTWNAAWNLWTGNGVGVISSVAGVNAGDQLMVAGTGSRTYTDSVAGNASGFGGANAQYPSMALSYDPASPSDSTKYGRLTGPDMPVLNLGTSFTKTAWTYGYFGAQGLELKCTNALAYASGGSSYDGSSNPGIIYQNCRFNGSGIGINPGTSTFTAATNTPTAGLISKCSMWNASGFFAESSDAFWIQDFVIAHCGWNIGASRDDTIANGGAQVFTHNFYYHASCTNGRFDRIVTIDSSLEGLGCRGDIVGAQIIVAIDNVVALGPGGFSNSANYATEAPNGVHFKLDDAVCMGGDYCSPGHPGGVGMQCNNTVPGSYVRNCALFDNPAATDGNFITQGNPNLNNYVSDTRNNAGQAPQGFLCDKWSAWSYAQTAEQDIGTDMAHASLSWSNSVLEVLPSGWNGTVTNTSTRSSPPAGYKTRTQTYSALGFSSKAAAVNAMLWRPDLPWAQAISSISLPAMGLTPTFASISPPSMAGITPAVVYPTSLVNLTIGTTSFAHNVASSTMLGATSGNNFTLSSSDLPTGFSLSGRQISCDGVTAVAGNYTFHVTETSKDTLGSHTTAFTVTVS